MRIPIEAPRQALHLSQRRIEVLTTEVSRSIAGLRETRHETQKSSRSWWMLPERERLRPRIKWSPTDRLVCREPNCDHKPY